MWSSVNRNLLLKTAAQIFKMLKGSGKAMTFPLTFNYSKSKAMKSSANYNSHDLKTYTSLQVGW